MNVNEASRTQRLVWIPDDFVSDVVFKGDFVGHPFRGNQWADSSGASTIGASEASDVNSERNIKLRTIADDVNDKMDVLLASGARVVQFFRGDGIENVDRAVYNQQIQETPLKGQSETFINGSAMLEEAINDDGKIVVIETKDGTLSGAISMSGQPDDAETEPAIWFNLVEIGGVPPESTWTLMKSAGSTMKVDGIGSALFASAINVAAESGSGLYLVPLDEPAMLFWESKGFATVNRPPTGNDEISDEQSLNPKTTYQYLDAESVQTIYENLEDVF